MRKFPAQRRWSLSWRWFLLRRGREESAVADSGREHEKGRAPREAGPQKFPRGDGYGVGAFAMGGLVEAAFLIQPDRENICLHSDVARVDGTLWSPPNFEAHRLRTRKNFLGSPVVGVSKRIGVAALPARGEPSGVHRAGSGLRPRLACNAGVARRSRAYQRFRREGGCDARH